MQDDDKKKRRTNESESTEDAPEGGKNNKGMDFKSSRYVFLLILLGVMVALFFGKNLNFITPQQRMDWTTFRSEFAAGKFKEVHIADREVTAVYDDAQPTGTGKTRRTVMLTAPSNPWDKKWFDEMATTLNKPVYWEEPSQLVAMLWLFLPWMCLFIFLYFVFFRQLRGPGGPGGVLSFGKSRATLITKEKIKKTFKDVAGVDEAKQEVEEIVGFLKNPKKFQRLGGRIPKGVLLIGTPGTGKTLLAKSIAGEADVPFFSISGSDFVEMFVGVGASRVRDLFLQARENSPCIIFLDEIDAVGRRRGTGIGGGHDEREQTLNEILVQMDGMESDDKIIVMAATNRADVLDPALLRPGRFDRHVYVDLPDVKGREEILRVHCKRVKLAPEVDLSVLAKSTPGLSGADLENIINEAALIAVTKDKDGIDMNDLDEARDKVAWGREKRSRVMDEAERWITAYHEAGHALLGYLLPECDKPSKVTIIPRGPFLGATMSTPEKDVYSHSRKQLIGRLKMCYGGRIAEKMFTGDITSGAKGDIDQASLIARKMICEFGMSDKLGPIKYAEDEEAVFLGRELGHQRAVSDATAIAIDEEVRSLIDTCYKEADRILSEHRNEIELIAKALMEHEVVSGEDLDSLVKFGKIERKPPVNNIVHRPLPKAQLQPKQAPIEIRPEGITPQPA